MTKLSAEAYAIVEGRHSDPFHYLGLHSRGRPRPWCARSCPKPRMSRRSASTAKRRSSQRIHDAGLFAGALPNGSKRYQLRARFGDNVVDLDDPYRFPPVLSDFDLYLLGEGTHQRHLRQARRASDDARRRRRRRLRGAGAECASASAWSAISTSGMRDGIRCACAASAIGNCSCPHATRRRSLQVRHHRPARPASAAEIRSDGLCRRNAPEHGLDRLRRNAGCRIRARRRRGINALRRADVDLRGASRLVAAQGRQRVADLSRAGRAAAGLCRAISASPISNSCRSASIRSTAHGAISRPACTRRPAGSARRRTFPRWSMPAIAKASACCSTGCPGISPTIRTGSAISTAPRSTSTPTRCRAATSTGAR